MTFEDQLRHRLRSNADDLHLTGRGVDTVVGRARQRQRHRRAAVGAVGGVALLAGTVGYVGLRDQGGQGVAVGTVPGLPSSGPLELEWTSTEGGVFTHTSSAVSPDGTIYALSTAPGTTWDDPDFRYDNLYRLGADGTWSDEGSGSGQTAVAAGSSLLYGVSTAPAAGGIGFGPRLSTSSDGGTSWDSSDLPAIDWPSDTISWQPLASVSVVAHGEIALAAVNTGFYPTADSLSQLGVPTDGMYGYQITDQGLEVTIGGSDARGGPLPTTPDGATDDTAVDPRSTTVIGWSELGVSGRSDLSRTAVYRNTGDGWVPVADPGLSQTAGAMVIGDEFVINGQVATDAIGNAVVGTVASTDGETWRTVERPGRDGAVVGLGSLWVVPSDDDTGLLTSSDGGATWASVALPQIEGLNHPYFYVSSGPLGLAAVVQDGDDPAGNTYVAVTRDLQNWSVQRIQDLTPQLDLGAVTVVVGTDRVVVTVSVMGDELPGSPSRSRTLVGTPVRVGTSSDVPPTTVAAPEATTPVESVVTTSVPASRSTSDLVTTSSTSTTAPPSTTTTTTG